MKKYKVSFFAVLMMIPPAVGYGDASGALSSLGAETTIQNTPTNFTSFFDTNNVQQVRNDASNFNNTIASYKSNSSSDDDDTDVNEKLEKLEKKRDIAHGLVSGASSAMTGIGGMEMAQAISEQKSDADAEEEMGAYLTTFKCDYGKSQKYDYSTQDIILPGGNELVQYYTEYKTLADQLKADKTALGLTPGIESQVVYDKAESGLYKIPVVNIHHYPVHCWMKTVKMPRTGQPKKIKPKSVYKLVQPLPPPVWLLVLSAIN